MHEDFQEEALDRCKGKFIHYQVEESFENYHSESY